MDFEKFASQMEETMKSKETRLMDLFYDLINTWDEPELKSQDVSLSDLLELGENFSEMAERFEENYMLFDHLVDVVGKCSPVRRRRIL